MVLLAESAQGLQNALDSLYSYCKIWRIEVNTDKTNVIKWLTVTSESASRCMPMPVYFPFAVYIQHKKIENGNETGA